MKTGVCVRLAEDPLLFPLPLQCLSFIFWGRRFLRSNSWVAAAAAIEDPYACVSQGRINYAPSLEVAGAMEMIPTGSFGSTFRFHSRQRENNIYSFPQHVAVCAQHLIWAAILRPGHFRASPLRQSGRLQREGAGGLGQTPKAQGLMWSCVLCSWGGGKTCRHTVPEAPSLNFPLSFFYSLLIYTSQ